MLSANEGAVDTEFPATETQILRSRLQAGNTVVTARSPEVVIDSSLLVGGSQGLEAYASFGAANGATLSNDTIDVGTPKQITSGTAIRARAENSVTAAVTLVNSIALEKVEVAGTISCGPEKGNALASPATLFVPGSDWHLRPGSPAVDTGVGGDGSSTTDLDGARGSWTGPATARPCSIEGRTSCWCSRASGSAASHGRPRAPGPLPSRSCPSPGSPAA